MIRRKISMRSRAIAAVLTGLTVLIGGEYVRAASRLLNTDVTGTISVAYAAGPAELDPVFQQKLLERARGRYERVHTLSTVQ
jgi:hypothetical protein